MAQGRTDSPLYGDLLNGMLFATLLPFVTFKVVTTVWGIGETATIEDMGDTIVPQYRLVLQWAVGATALLCNGMAFYGSCYEPNRKSLQSSKSERKQPNETSIGSYLYQLSRSSRTWSYGAFVLQMFSTAFLALNNWPHVDEHTLPGHFVWNLLVASANVSHSLTIKLGMGGINLLVGLAIVFLFQANYLWTTFGPLLVGITVMYSLAHYWSSTRLARLEQNSMASSEAMSDSTVDAPPSAATKAIPFSSASDKAMEPMLTWEGLHEQLAFGLVVCFMVRFLFVEVHGIMTQPGYFVQGSWNIFQTGILGAAGFVASGLLRQSNEDVEATLLMASTAFHASPTAVAIANQRRYIEDCNAAFDRLCPVTTRANGPKRSIDAALGVSNGDVERLQRCFDKAAVCQAANIETTNASQEFTVQDKIFEVSVYPFMDSAGDEEAGVAPLIRSWFQPGQRNTRFIVTIKDVTLDHTLARTIHDATVRQNHGQNEALMKDMVEQLSSMNTSHTMPALDRG